ncbi:carbon-nitrogen hydrolase family protein [Niabella beijingensis]|uniref:carbon-nitrogen hydrolase family protein n=1 Tax=Niabella beijingensis TaxID=2872700 RepID=UPI001CBE19C2|nr:carbon-nitrogen hydrolase family protein [Niabella beijingensis]MBZ4191263.1 carbon-nitrogen hydrolase family protein [Niabella beijingensis]
MNISVAQVRSVKGNIPANIEIHKRTIAVAADYKAAAVFFPELSVTGYEPELAEQLATNREDQRFNDFQLLSDNNKITIGIGMPTVARAGIHISMIIFQPHVPRQVYSKQELHTDELPYFVNGDGQLILEAGNQKIAPAICFESLQMHHATTAKALGADLYLASVAKSQKGVDKAMLHYPVVAKNYSIPVLMANCVGYCDNFNSAGKSSVWTKEGRLAGQLDNEEGLLIFDTDTEHVTSRLL